VIYSLRQLKTLREDLCKGGRNSWSKKIPIQKGIMRIRKKKRG